MTRPRNGRANLALSLSFEFEKYLMQHPEVSKRIPRNALIVFQLDGNPSFNRWALTTSEAQRRARQKTVTVRVRSLTPPLSRIASVELVC